MMLINPYIYSKEFSPTDISELKLWLKSDVGITKDGSNFVSQWDDQSGSGNNVVSTGAYQPLWVGNILNGSPEIQFDGINDYMQKTFSSSLSQPNTIIVVVKQRTFNNVSSCIYDGTVTNERHMLLNYNQPPDGGAVTNHALIYAGNYTANMYYAETNSNTTYTSVALFNGVNSSVWNNGNNVLLNKDAGNNQLSTIRIGELWVLGIYPFYGGYYEMLIYNKALNTTERQNIELYLRTKYNHY